MEITTTFTAQEAELGLKYSGFANQTEITDPVVWINKIIKANLRLIVETGIQFEYDAKKGALQKEADDVIASLTL